MNVPDSGEASDVPKVFVSYATGDPAHERQVLEFATFLRQAGVDARHDKWAGSDRRDRVVWRGEQFKLADFVLVIASPEYKRLAETGVSAVDGQAHLDAAALRDRLSGDLRGETRRILPVVLPGRSAAEIPWFLFSTAATRYDIAEFTLDGVRSLLRALTGQPEHEVPPLGPLIPPHPDEMIIAGAVPVAPAVRVLAAGTEIAIGGARYLVHGAYFEERESNDRAAVLRQARALNHGGPREHVWLRQIDIREPSRAATAVFEAVGREHRLLVALNGGHRALPRVRELVPDGHLATLITVWPGDPGDPLSGISAASRRSGRRAMGVQPTRYGRANCCGASRI